MRRCLPNSFSDDTDTVKLIPCIRQSACNTTTAKSDISQSKTTLQHSRDVRTYMMKPYTEKADTQQGQRRMAPCARACGHPPRLFYANQGCGNNGVPRSHPQAETSNIPAQQPWRCYSCAPANHLTQKKKGPHHHPLVLGRMLDLIKHLPGQCRAMAAR